MIFKLNRQLILDELKSFVFAFGTFALTFLFSALMFEIITHNSWDINSVAVTIFIVSIIFGVLTAYFVKGRKVPFFTLGIVFIIAFWIYGDSFLISPTQIFGKGMEPSYPDRSSVLIDKFTAGFFQPKRGDVILMRDPNSNSEMIRRIIGLPGEKVNIIGDLVIINEKSWLVEPYVTEKIYECFLGSLNSVFNIWGPYSLSSNEYLVLPDNRNVKEIGEWGANRQPIRISRSDVTGRIIGNKIAPQLSDLPISDLMVEYRSPNLNLKLLHSKECVISEKEDNFLEIKDERRGINVMTIKLFTKNPQNLSTEEWIRRNFKVVPSVYCREDENCKVLSGDQLFEIDETLIFNDLQFITGVYKDSKSLNNLFASRGTFVAAEDRIYLINTPYKEFLEALRLVR